MGKDVIDYVLYNTEEISSDLLQKYAADGEFPVRTDHNEFSRLTGTRALGVPLVSNVIAHQDAADKAIRRTLIRHDATRVCEELKLIIRS